MPRPIREQRRAERERIARNWGIWLADALSDAAENSDDPIDTKTLIERAEALGATFDKSNISHWLSGDTSADPTNAVLIARVLHKKPEEALRAAGHTTLAQSWGRDPVLEQLDRIDDREMAQRMAAEYERDMTAARVRLEQEMTALRNQFTQTDPSRDAGEDAV